MLDGEIVHVETLEITFEIREYDIGGGKAAEYDWTSSAGDRSTELFSSIADARRDALRYLGGY